MRALILLVAFLAGGVVDAGQSPPRPAVRLDPIAAILDAFKTHQVVTLPDAHGGEELNALLLSIVRDPRIPGVVNDVIVEFGSARYQDLMDRFVRGDDIPDTALRQVWQNSTQLGLTFETRHPEEFFRAVRSINAPLPPERRLRVVLGDPPIDWDHVRTRADHRKWIVQRDSYPADTIAREVIARGRRGLVVYGNGHLLRRQILSNYDMSDWQAQTIVSLLERNGHRVFVLFGDRAGVEKVQPDAASWPPMSVALVQGSVLGAADFSAFNPVETRFAVKGIDTFEPIPKDAWRSLRMEEQVDAILLLPQTSTTAPLSPALCADRTYVTARLERMAMVSSPPSEVDRLKRACGIK